MKKKKILLFLLIITGAWLLATTLMTWRSLFQYEEPQYPFQNHVNLLEKKIEKLLKSNKELFHEVRSHIKQISSYQLIEQIKIDSQGTDKNWDESKIQGEEKKSLDVPKGVEDLQNLKVSTSSPAKNSSAVDPNDRLMFIPKIRLEDGRPVIAVLVISCDRISVRRALDRLIEFRPSAEQFPIIVSQDCGHKGTTEVIRSYNKHVFLIQQPDLSDIPVPPKEKKFKGYFKIARHYKWALNHAFFTLGFETIIIVEDDLDISSDFYEYFLGTHPILRNDPSLWCVSAWNDNGKAGLIDESVPEMIQRTDFFPGLGWMLTNGLWKELSTKWPASYWDDWIRKPEQRKGRACLRPEIPRTKTFGKIGVSNGLFFEKHLKYIKLNDEFTSFTKLNLTYLMKNAYDSTFVNGIYALPEMTFPEVSELGPDYKENVRVVYKTKGDFKKYAKALGLMDDFRSGVARTAYQGIVNVFKDGRRVYLTPVQPWTGYNVTWN